MNAASPDSLAARFGIPDALAFESGPGGFPFAKIATPEATAEVCLHGGHLTAFAPAGQEPVIWMSPAAVFAPSKAIRGGIPVCWPWFGDHPDDPASKPAHGFARTSLWEVTAASQPEPGAVRLELGLPAAAAPPGVFPPAYNCTLAITVARTLALELTTTNLSDSPFVLTAALHTYLNVGDISQIRCEGLDGTRYRDKMDGYRQKSQSGDILIDSPTDRVYEDTTGDTLVRDGALGRTIRVRKSGSSTTVVWNPWAAGAAKMADMPDDGYQTMLCVEAANAGTGAVTLAPGRSHALATMITVI
ncbi:D-hexose-6-phosphate mutarotase [soil metagenome]